MGTLRLLLAFAVASEHSPFGPLPGFGFLAASTAVQVFFIISGFFITMVINENESYKSVRAFYASRYLRLYPMYIVCALVTLSLNQANPYSFKGSPGSYLDYFALLGWPSQLFILFSNLTIFLQDWFLFLQVSPGAGTLDFTPAFNQGSMPPVYAFLWIAQGWSLGIELVFYLLAPFVARKPLRLLILIGMGIVSRVVTARYFGELVDPWYYRFVVSEMALFGLGGLAYHCYVRYAPLQRIAVQAGAAALGIAVLIVGFRQFLGPLQPAFGQAIPALNLYDPLLLAFMILFVPAIFAFTRKNAFDRYIGELSYPVYLTQVGVAAALSPWSEGDKILGSLTYAVSILLVSGILLLIVDRPVTRLRANRFGAGRGRASEMLASNTN